MIKKGTMRSKLIRTMIIMEFLPLLIFVFILIVLLIKHNENEYVMKLETALKQESYELNMVFQQEMERCGVIAKNEVLFSNLNRDFNKNLSARLEFKQQLQSVLYMIDNFRYGNDVEYLFYTNNRDCLVNDRIIWLEELEVSEQVYHKLINTREREYIWDCQTSKDGQLYLIIYQKISAISDYTNILECVIPFDNYIHDKLEAAEQDGMIHIYCDGQGKVLYSNSEEIEAGSLFDEELWGKELFSEDLINGHRLVTVVSPSVYDTTRAGIIKIMFWIFLVIFVLLCANILFMSAQITKELEDFTEKIANNPLNYLDYHQTSHYEAREVNLIEKNFLKVLTELNKLHEEKLEQEKYNNSLELELLQAQINPHLLYNTLSTIKWRMLDREEYEEADIIDYMVRYYRLVLNKGRNIVSLAQELQMINTYISLVSCTKQTSILLNVDVLPELMEAQIPKLLLQPFVENAVLHGFKLLEDREKMISIRAVSEGSKICIFVSDNGMGIAEKTARELETGNYCSEYGGYGIVNVIQRMRACYGEEFTITIRGDHGTGTTIKIVYPMITVNNE